MKSQISIHF